MKNRLIAPILGLCTCAALTLPLAGCTQPADQSPDTSDGVLRLLDFDAFIEVPLIRQGTTYSCGIAAMHSLLRWASYDLDINDEYLMEDCGTTPETGTNYQSMMDYMEATGLLEVSWRENLTAEDLKSSIQQGSVVLLPIQAWDGRETPTGEFEWFEGADYIDHWSAGHWVILCGYNDQRALFMDPSTAGTYTEMTWEDLEYRWHDSADYVDDDTPFTAVDHCGIVVTKTGTEEYDNQVVMPLR